MPFSPFRKIIALFFFSAWWVSLVSPAGAEVEVLFSPEGAIKEHILKEVESTTSTLDLAVHEMTSSDVAQAFLKAKGRGVKVRIIADSRQAKMKPSQITYLIHQGILVKVLGGKGKAIMNHRFAILDGRKVITGSSDWSRFLESSSYENVLILTDSDVVASYQKEFDRLWREKRVVK
jgi:phosphatidylserine/phosphatidylglycerophosphate/cardiolipin synthase-like enzyme